MMPILHPPSNVADGPSPETRLPGVMTPGQFGPMSTDVGILPSAAFTRIMSCVGMPSVTATMTFDAGLGRLEDAVGREGRRDEEHGGVGPGGFDGVGYGVEDRQAVGVFLSALARGDAADHLRAVVEAALRVERRRRSR
jgi:hypothetical protein